MKKTLYNLVTAIVVLSMGMFCSCSEDNEGFITATEDDFHKYSYLGSAIGRMVSLQYIRVFPAMQSSLIQQW